jgi:hypothetical protein
MIVIVPLMPLRRRHINIDHAWRRAQETLRLLF